MKYLPATTWTNTQGAEQRGGLLSGRGSGLRSVPCLRGKVFAFISIPALSFRVTPPSRPGGYLPCPPGYQRSRLSECCRSLRVASGKVTPSGLPKTGVNCAHEKSSHNWRSHCMRESMLSRRNRLARFLLCGLPGNSPCSPTDRRKCGSI